MSLSVSDLGRATDSELLTVVARGVQMGIGSSLRHRRRLGEAIGETA
jgi:hypothetical protein